MRQSLLKTCFLFVCFILNVIIFAFHADASENKSTARYVINFEDVKDAFPSSMMSDDQFLELIEKRAFLFYWYEANPKNGLVKDRANNFIRSQKLADAVSSSASTGFALSAICIGVERGWVDKDSGYERILTVLKYYRDQQQNFNGFFYHWLNMETGKREWNSEVSTIDTTLFFAGVIFAAEYFKGTEIETIAEQLYQNADWQHYQNNGLFLSMGWTPESGFIPDRWNRYCEGLILDVLAIASPTHGVSPDVWRSTEKPVGTYKGMTSIACGPLFTHHYSQLYIDYRNMNDGFANYHINTMLAALCNREFCVENKGKSKTFNEFSWGLTACDGPGVYKVFGAPPGAPGIEGIAAPTCPGGSLVFSPAICIRSLRYIYDNDYKLIWGHYGFCDSYDVGNHWHSPDVIGIDQGAIMLSIENYRSGLVWKYFTKNKYIQDGLKKIGFKIGKGNPVSLEGRWQMKKINDYQNYNDMIKDNSGWTNVDLPEGLAYLGMNNYRGFIWFKKKFNFSDDDLNQFEGESLGLSLGAIDDVDITYLNGMRIGGTGQISTRYASAWNKSRVYPLRQEMFNKNGENILGVLVYVSGNTGGTGGIYRGPLWIAPKDQLEYQSLK